MGRVSILQATVSSRDTRPILSGKLCYPLKPARSKLTVRKNEFRASLEFPLLAGSLASLLHDYIRVPFLSIKKISRPSQGQCVVEARGGG